MFIHPSKIHVPPDRQRRDLSDVSDLQASIAQIGLINPIIVRIDKEKQQVVLVAGGRRRQACENLDRVLEFGRDVRFWEDLDPLTAQIIELEENLKRTDLDWRDHVRAVERIHKLYMRRAHGGGPPWTTADTARALSINEQHAFKLLRIARGLEAGRLAGASGLEHADLILARQSDRMSEQIVDEIVAGSLATFDFTEEPTDEPNMDSADGDRSPDGIAGSGSTGAPPLAPMGGDNGVGIIVRDTNNSGADTAQPITCASFLDWAPAYSGPKFNLIHVDFPYGVMMHNEVGQQFTADQGAGTEALYANSVDIYFRLLDCLCENLNRFVSYQAHLVFWFSMTHYTDTKRKLESAGLRVFPHPLIWLKYAGTAPGQFEHPRQIYDTALLCSTGSRKLVKTGDNAYAAPIPSNRIHPSEKSASMLKHFLEMLVDETTTVLDPTCGSGMALRVAEELGARRVLGLEIDPSHADTALKAFYRARLMREASRA